MKKILTLIFPLLLLMVAVVYAAAPFYGQFYYGQTDIQVTGDLTKSGLGKNDSRPSKALWHNVRFQNHYTGEILYPEYLPAVQFDLIETQTGDNFAGRRGYLLVPVDEQTVKQIATWANGNPDYVWKHINPETHDHWYKPSWYKIETTDDYVAFGDIIFYSGGGDYKAISYVGSSNGVSSPVFDSTFGSTPKPKIDRFAAKEGGQLDPPSVNEKSKLYIKANTYAFQSNGIVARIGVNSEQSILVENPPIKTSSYTSKLTGKSITIYSIDGDIPINTFLSGRPAGTYNLTLTVYDPYYRSTSHTITVNYQPASQTSGCTKPYFAYGKSNAGASIDTTLGMSSSIQIGGYVLWGFEYNPHLCIVFDQSAGHNGLEGFKKLNEPYKVKEHTLVGLKLWKYAFNYTSAGIKLKNYSDITDPLVGYLKDKNGKTLQRIELQKGQEINISLPSGQYTIEFPTPLKEKGFWDNAETTVLGGYPATKNYPEYQSVIQSLIDLANSL